MSGEESPILEQLLPYPGGKPEDAGRRSSTRTGIIGKVAREGRALTARRTSDDDAAFDAEMIHDWGYTEAEAKRLTRDRKSWMAVPIFATDPSKVFAILFLDSNIPGFFDHAIQATVVRGSIAMTYYMVKRYQ